MKDKKLLEEALARNPQSQPEDALVVPCDDEGNPVKDGATHFQFWPPCATAPDGRSANEVAIGTLSDLRDDYGI